MQQVTIALKLGNKATHKLKHSSVYFHARLAIYCCWGYYCAFTQCFVKFKWHTGAWKNLQRDWAYLFLLHSIMIYFSSVIWYFASPILSTVDIFERYFPISISFWLCLVSFIGTSNQNFFWILISFVSLHRKSRLAFIPLLWQVTWNSILFLVCVCARMVIL